MRCWDIWRCWWKIKPRKPAFENIQFWWYDTPLVWNWRTIGIYCQPVVDDELVVTVSDPSKAQFLSVILQRQDEYTRVYEWHFNILSEWYFQVTVASKNNPSLSFTNEYYATIPVPVETFTFEDQSINVPSWGAVMFNASYTPTDAYVWSWLDVRDVEEWDTYASIYSWSSGNLRMYAQSTAPEWATRTMVAKHFDEPVGSVEADIIENILPETAEFTEHSITMTVWDTHTMQVTTVPANCTVIFAAQPSDYSIVSNSLLDVYANSPWTTTLHLLDWNNWVEYDTCEVTVEAPVYPTLEFVDWDTGINIWETWTLRFRYTNATSFSCEDDPSIANVTGISSDEEYCYITYEGVSSWSPEIRCIAWNWNINVGCWIYVVVYPPQLETITAISQFSTDYRCNVWETWNWNLWTVTPSENGDVNSLSYSRSEWMQFWWCNIVDGNTLIGQIAREEAWDKNFEIQLQNWNSYTYTFHVSENIPVESIEEHFAYNIDVPVWERVPTYFTYSPTNATNFNGLSFNYSDESIADVRGLSWNDWTLTVLIYWASEWTATVSWNLNGTPFTSINATVAEPAPVTPTLSFVEIRNGVYWQCIFTSNPEWAGHNEQVEISDEDMYWQIDGYLPCTLTLSVDPASSIDLSDVTFSAHQYWWRDDWGTYEYMDVDNDWYDFYDFSYQWNWLREFKTYNGTWWTARVTLTATSNTNPNVSVSLNCLIQAPMMDEPFME